ncbi:XRE family transcriptional regulator [Cereibacter sphaeroides]|nr:XRE family transcriptional regulator [Cereibacter sphaeroides]
MKLALGKVLRARGVTQTKLADAVGLTTGYVSLLVSNNRKPSHEVLLSIADYLGVSVNDLLDPDDPALPAAPESRTGNDLDDEIIAHLDLLTEPEKQLLLAAARGFSAQRKGEGE